VLYCCTYDEGAAGRRRTGGIGDSASTRPRPRRRRAPAEARRNACTPAAESSRNVLERTEGDTQAAAVTSESEEKRTESPSRGDEAAGTRHGHALGVRRAFLN
jgi:hypothetical protein